MKNLKPWIITIGACAGIFISLSAFKVMEIQAAIANSENMPEFSETVEAHTVQPVEHAQTITVLGKALAPQHLVVTNEYPGKIARINFDAGQQVKKGDILVQQDISEERARLHSAQARAKLAKAKYKRISELRDSNAVNQNDLDQAQSEMDIALADIELLQAQINKKTIRATFNGRTGIHQLKVGQYLQPNTELTQLVANSQYIWVDFNLPQVYQQLPVGSFVIVKKIQDGALKSAQAEIIAKSPIVSDTTRSIEYRARLKLTELNLPSHAIVELEVPVSAPEEFLSVPNTSIRHSSQGSYVYVLTPNDENDASKGYRSFKKVIKIKEKTDDITLLKPNSIEGGLSEGDLVAAIGAFKLYEGGLVFVADPNAKNTVAGE